MGVCGVQTVDRGQRCAEGWVSPGRIGDRLALRRSGDRLALRRAEDRLVRVWDLLNFVFDTLGGKVQDN